MKPHFKSYLGFNFLPSCPWDTFQFGGFYIKDLESALRWTAEKLTIKELGWQVFPSILGGGSDLRNAVICAGGLEIGL